MKLSLQSESILDSLFQNLADKFSSSQSEPALTDFHLQPVRESGELNVYDDDDNLLCHTTIVEWADESSDADEDDADAFYDKAARHLRQSLARVDAEGALQQLNVWKPYSFVLVDDEREVVCELLLVDDDTLLVNDTLLQGLYEELNDFFEQLLGED